VRRQDDGAVRHGMERSFTRCPSARPPGYVRPIRVMFARPRLGHSGEDCPDVGGVVLLEENEELRIRLRIVATMTLNSREMVGRKWLRRVWVRVVCADRNA